MIDGYAWRGGREAMLRFGAAEEPVVVVAMPLFEEANRTRGFVVTILRGLAERGVAGALPDLPGTGESLTAIEAVRLGDWREAFDAGVATLGRRVDDVAVRGGALVRHIAAVRNRCLFAPTTGAAVLRDLVRTQRLGGGDAVDPASLDSPGPPVELAGNRLSRALLRDLRDATAGRTGPSRVLRLRGESGDADRMIDGAPLWRRAEPDNDPALAAILADDIAAWVRACDA